MSVSALSILAGFGLGIVLGVVFFGGLWWTTQRLPDAGNPAVTPSSASSWQSTQSKSSRCGACGNTGPDGPPPNTPNTAWQATNAAAAPNAMSSRPRGVLVDLMARTPRAR